MAKLFPTYRVITPVCGVTIRNAGLDAVWLELLIAPGGGASACGDGDGDGGHRLPECEARRLLSPARRRHQPSSATRASTSRR